MSRTFNDAAVDAFAAAMKTRLEQKRIEGRFGWEDPALCTAEDLSLMLTNHVLKGNTIDVANFAMMLHQRGERISQALPATDSLAAHKAAQVPLTDEQIRATLELNRRPSGLVKSIVRAIEAAHGIGGVAATASDKAPLC